MFAAAVESVGASVCVPAALPDPAGGRTVVAGAGKAAAAMARAVEREWSARGHPPPDGVVVTRYGHAVDCRHVEVIEAAHPVPDEAGIEAAERILGLAGELGPDDLLLCLVSGGGSALLAAPAPGVTLEEKQAVNRALLASGANITEMNTVRKHLSRIKGGRLAAASHPARCHAVLLSDVPGDDPATVASGPTVADPTTVADAREVVERYGVALSRLRRRVVGGARIGDPETGRPAPGPKHRGGRGERPAGTRGGGPGGSRGGGSSPSSSATRSRARRARWRSCMPASPARPAGGASR